MSSADRHSHDGELTSQSKWAKLSINDEPGWKALKHELDLTIEGSIGRKISVWHLDKEIGNGIIGWGE